MARPTVFVVDDDASVRTALRRLLAPLRHPVRLFASAEQFTTGIDSHASGCLVMDVRLPGMSGLELQQRMAEQGWILPIIFVTSQDDTATREAALSRGAADYLPKPFSCDRLLESVRRALAPDGSDSGRPSEADRGSRPPSA
jgi:FixJ family two-component response regulator